MAFGTRLTFDTIRERNAADISGTYSALGLPINENVRILSLNSSLIEQVYISFNGETNNLRMSSNSFKLFDIASNKVRDDGLFLGMGTQIYVKFVSTTTLIGSIWLEVLYAEGGK